MSKLEISKMAWVSTSHLAWAEAGVRPDPDVMNFMESASMECECGWLVRVDALDNGEDYPIPQSIKDVLQFVRDTDPSVEYVRFDADGPTYDELKDYNE